jgi:hypothetical protein
VQELSNNNFRQSGQTTVEQKAPVQSFVPGFLLGAFRLLRIIISDWAFVSAGLLLQKEISKVYLLCKTGQLVEIMIPMWTIEYHPASLTHVFHILELKYSLFFGQKSCSGKVEQRAKKKKNPSKFFFFFAVGHQAVRPYKVRGVS